MQKITLINHSDTRGGASVVTFRLMKALCALGYDARMVVMHKGTDSLRVAEAGTPLQRKMRFLEECAQIYTHNGFNRRDLFKVSTGSYGLPLHRHPWVEDADAIILSWVNQGMLSLDEIARIAASGKPIAWTLHDMWPVTGVCHHAGTCTGFMSGCGKCPLLGSHKANDLSAKVFRRKAELYKQVPVKFVAISQWMARKCRESALTANGDISVIANAFPVDDYSTVPAVSRRQLRIPDNGTPLIVMGAARLDDPIKNLPLAIDALNIVAQGGTQVTAVFYGNIRNPEALTALRMPYVHLGAIDAKTVAQVFAHATVVLSTSHYETLPTTLIEGMAAGATPVATSNGGQPDIVDNGTTGYLADSADAQTVADLISRALDAPFDRTAQHAAVARRFAARNIAAAYARLLGL